MTVNDLELPFCVKCVSGSATNGLGLWLSDKTVRKSAELPIYCQRQKCSPVIIVSSKVRFMRIGFAGEGASNESGVVQNGDFRLFCPLYRTNLHM